MKQNKTCINCSTPLKGPVCHECGQKYHENPWTTQILIEQLISQLTDIEKGFLYTIKMMFVAPGILVQDYWRGKTKVYYNPFRYVLIWTAVNLAFSFWFGIDDLLQESLQPAQIERNLSTDEIKQADQRFDTWLNALVLLLLPVFSFFTMILFSKKKNNYAENLIMNAFMMGQQSLISAFVQVIFYLIPSLFFIYIPFNFILGLTYNTYSFRHIFGENIWLTLLKALLLGLIGLVTFGAFIALASMIAINST